MLDARSELVEPDFWETVDLDPLTNLCTVHVVCGACHVDWIAQAVPMHEEVIVTHYLKSCERRNIIRASGLSNFASVNWYPA